MSASARRRRKHLSINPLFDIVSNRRGGRRAVFAVPMQRARRFRAFDRPIKCLPAGYLRGIDAAASLKRQDQQAIIAERVSSPRHRCRGLIEARPPSSLMQLV